MVVTAKTAIPLGQTAILGGGVIWSLSELVTFSVKVQRKITTNPDQWLTVQTVPSFAYTATEGLRVDYQTAHGSILSWDPTEIGNYRWLIDITSANRTARDTVYFDSVTPETPMPSGGILELVSAHETTGVIVNYIASENFDHGVLNITHSRTGQVTQQAGVVGANTITGLDPGVWYYFQMEAYSEASELGGISNIVTAYIYRSDVVPADSTRSPFHEIVIKNNPLGGTLITWGLDHVFCDEEPYLFEVQWAETAHGAWETVQTGPLTDTYFAIDEVKRIFAKEIESYYRVILTTSKATYISYAKSANSYWNKRDWLLGREICRKERLLATKFVGWSGYMLKRKIWGVKCPICTDFDTDEVNNSSCTVCFGTGIVGGYWEGYPSFVYNMSGGSKQSKEVDDNVGLTENVILQNMRVLAYPHISTNDIFVHEGSGRRYFIRPVKIGATVKGVPIIYRAELHLIPYTDPAYMVPIVPVAPGPYDDPITGEPLPEPDEPLPEPDPIESAPFYIFWYLGEWYVGPIIGEQLTALYSTSDGYPLPDGLDSYNWVPVTGDSSMSVSINCSNSYEVTVPGDTDVSGTYVATDSEFSGLTVFVRT